MNTKVWPENFWTMIWGVVAAGLVISNLQAQEPNFSDLSPTLASVNQNTQGVAPTEPNLFPSEASALPPQFDQSRDADSPTRTERPIGLTERAAYDSFGARESLFRDDIGDQGALRPSSVGIQASRERQRLLAKAQEAQAAQDYNIKIGSMLFWFDAEFSAEYSDNVTGTTLGDNGSNGREDDFILRPQINMHGFLRVTRFNSLSIGLGLGYIKYINHPEFDSNTSSVFVAPGSEFSFDVKVGDILFNIHDRPSVPAYTADQLTLRQTTEYSQFTNTAGISAVWDLNHVVLTAGYDHYNSIGLNSEVDTSDLSAEQFYLSALVRYSETLSGGVETGFSSTTYSEGFQNDGITYHAGLFAEFRATNFITLRAAAGYQGGSFDSGGQTEDNSGLGDYYANLTITHNLNAYFSHSLSAGHEAQLGTASNFVEVNYVRYQATWDIINRVSLSTDAFFEDAQESGGIFAQDIHRYGAGVYLGYLLTKKLSVGFHYVFIKRDGSGSADSPGGSLDYYENRVGLDFRYAF